MAHGTSQIRLLLILCLAGRALSGCGHLLPGKNEISASIELKPLPGESHFDTLTELVFPGLASQARWSFDGSWLTFLDHNPERPPLGRCNQVYRIRPNGHGLSLISGGLGRMDSPSYFPDNSRILYSSSMPYSDACPAPIPAKVLPLPSNAILLDPSYQLVSTRSDGSDTLALEPGGPRAYNAGAAVCGNGNVIFTSDRDGDPALYEAKLDPLGSIEDIRRITQGPGFATTPTFSSDCTRIAWSAWRPSGPQELSRYKADLKRHIVRPDQLEIWMADADGSHARQLTLLGATSGSPTFSRDGEKIVFASNWRELPNGRSDLYLIRRDGTGLERVTFSKDSDAFPVFSPDGQRLAFSSGRSKSGFRLMIAGWKERGAGLRPPPLSQGATAPDRLAAIVDGLDAPDMGGRVIGTSGYGWAEDFVARQFATAGLRPFFSVYPQAQGGEGFKEDVRVLMPKMGAGPAFLAHNILGAWGNRCGKARPVLVEARLDSIAASGVAAMIEAALMIRSSPGADGCYLFAALSEGYGEEAGSGELAGLLASIHALPRAVLDLEAVDRMTENRLILLDVDTSPQWKDLVSRECQAQRLSCIPGNGLAPTPRLAPFLGARVPALELSTSPPLATDDTNDSLNATGEVQTARLMATLAIAAESLHKLRFSGKLNWSQERER